MLALARIFLFVLCLTPFTYLLVSTLSGGLGPDPAEAIMHGTGEWSLRMLLITLFISPLRQWFGWSVLLKVRRMLGLYAFFYACVHLLTFAHFYSGWTISRLLEELIERPYITVGFLALLCMLPMAVTSTRGMQRRLGRNWRKLHLMVYPSVVLICCHMIWQLRSDVGETLVYCLLVGVLVFGKIHPIIVNRSLFAIQR